MNLSQRLGGVLDALWSALDPDEPLFCECSGRRLCADCALSAAVDADDGWGAAAPQAPPIAAA